MYSLYTSSIILGMIITGTARSVGVKVLYQLGFDHPLFVAIVYLFGQSLALVVYGVSKWCSRRSQEEYAAVSTREEEEADDDCHSVEECSMTAEDDSSSEESTHSLLNEPQEQQQEQPPPPQENKSVKDPVATQRPPLQRKGSKTGLTQASHDAVAWVHLIPWQLKPLIPGLFNLANACLKWASFEYEAASVAEMLMSGLELVLSVVVARLIRKRLISHWRWAGAVIVAVGLLTVHAADVWQPSDEIQALSVEQAAQLHYEHFVGATFIVGQCVTAVGQDMAEELFLQESDFPATLLLGMEGLFGLAFGIPLYVLFAPEAPLETFRTLQQSSWTIEYLILLTVVFTVTGIFNIMATEVTSSMTRNMWKNCRTLLVWVLGLILFYAIGNKDLGEEWLVPESFFVLGGFGIMLSGIYVYYKHA